MAFASHIVTVRRLKKYIDDVIGKKANLPDTSKTIVGNIDQLNSDLTELEWSAHYNAYPFILDTTAVNRIVASWILQPMFFENRNMLYISLAFSTTKFSNGAAKIGVLTEEYKTRLPISDEAHKVICGVGNTYDVNMNYGCAVQLNNDGSLYVVKGVNGAFPAYCLLSIQIPLNPAS